MGFDVFGPSISMSLFRVVCGIWSLVFVFGVEFWVKLVCVGVVRSISISNNTSFVLIVVVVGRDVLLLSVGVKEVRGEVGRFWSCYCFWKVAVKSFLVERKS